MKKLKYVHPSSCGYDPLITYELSKILKEMDIKKARVMFKPINFKWEDMDKKKTAKKKNIVKDDRAE